MAAAHRASLTKAGTTDPLQSDPPTTPGDTNTVGNNLGGTPRRYPSKVTNDVSTYSARALGDRLFWPR